MGVRVAIKMFSIQCIVFVYVNSTARLLTCDIILKGNGQLEFD